MRNPVILISAAVISMAISSGVYSANIDYPGDLSITPPTSMTEGNSFSPMLAIQQKQKDVSTTVASNNEIQDMSVVKLSGIDAIVFTANVVGGVGGSISITSNQITVGGSAQFGTSTV